VCVSVCVLVCVLVCFSLCVIMVALCNRADHYIFIVFFLIVVFTYSAL